MSHSSQMMSKHEYLEMTCLILKEILNPQMLQSAVDAVAAKLNIADASNIAASILGVGSAAAIPEKQARGKDATDKKEKGKRGVIPYNAYTSWLTDFASHYGRHPAIVSLKTANPATRLGMPFAAEFYKTVPPEKKEAMMKVFQEVARIHNEAEAEGHGTTVMDTYRKFEAENPDKSIGKILGLESKPEFKTDPAQMKLEAAEARRHGAATAGGLTATPAAATVGKPDFSNAHHNGNGNGLDMQIDGEEDGEENGSQRPPAAATPGVTGKSDPSPGKDTGKSKDKGKDVKEKGKSKRKAEEAAAPAAADGDASVKKKEKKQKTEDGEKPKKHKKDKEKGKEEEKAPAAAAANDSAVKSEQKGGDRSAMKGDQSEKKKKKKDKEKRKAEAAAE